MEQKQDGKKIFKKIIMNKFQNYAGNNEEEVEHADRIDQSDDSFDDDDEDDEDDGEQSQ